MPAAISEALSALQSDQPLTAEATEAAVAAVLDPAATEVDVAALLTALAMRPLQAEHAAGAAKALRDRATRIAPQASPLLDTCGTGGTGLSTVNISTATAIVAAACGVSVAKHGNRGATSKSGSADVLEAFGLQLDLIPERVAACIDTVGIGFLYARALHPAMKTVAPVRARLPLKTVFNVIGPLSNPAGATHQLLGTGRPNVAAVLAEAAARLGTERTLVVCGDAKLDEVSLSGPTVWTLVERIGDAADASQPTTPSRGVWQPSDFGFDPVPVDAIRIETPEQSRALLEEAFAGRDTPAARYIMANTAAALWVMRRVDSVGDGVERARAALFDGAAQAKLDELVRFTTEAANA